MTYTPPSPQPGPDGPGQLGREALDSAPQPGSQPAASTPPPRRSKVPLVIGGLAALVVALAATVAVLATRTSADEPKAAATPSWTSVFAATTPAAPYSPPPPKEVTAAFGETLTATGGGDEVHFTVAADRTYTKTKYGTKPKNGVLYGIKVTVEVVDGSAYACACDFAFITVDGTVYEGSGFQVDGGLEAVELNRKQKAAGIVVFDVPAAATKGARIELREGSNNQGFWEVP